ncbi:MAG: tetratricopeptide repeat protein, partial [Streptomycetaceae bacterium]|nr:tetratricopeptide repeat protein [Streptomycetaceae bacterium]
MTADRHGLAMTATGEEAAAHLEQAVDSLLFFRPAVAPAVRDALAAAPGSPIAHVFSAY